MERYINKILMPDEHVIYIARIHWVIYTFGIIMLLIGATLGSFGDLIAYALMGATVAKLVELPLTIVALFAVVWGAIVLIFACLEQVSTSLAVTNQRVISKQGFIGAQIFESLVDKVTSVNIGETMTGRWLGYGTVTVLAMGGDLAAVKYVVDPYRFYNLVISTSRKAHKDADDEFMVRPAIEHKAKPELRLASGGKRSG